MKKTIEKGCRIGIYLHPTEYLEVLMHAKEDAIPPATWVTAVIRKTLRQLREEDPDGNSDA